jgi:hypothetical protein
MQTILEMIKAHDKFLRAPEVTCIGIGCRRFIYPDSDSDHNSPDSDPDYDSDGTKFVDTQRVGASTSPIPGQAEAVRNVEERSSVPVPVQPPSPLKQGEESGADSNVEETSGSQETPMSKSYDSYTTDLKSLVQDSFPSRNTDVAVVEESLSPRNSNFDEVQTETGTSLQPIESSGVRLDDLNENTDKVCN